MQENLRSLHHRTGSTIARFVKRKIRLPYIYIYIYISFAASVEKVVVPHRIKIILLYGLCKSCGIILCSWHMWQNINRHLAYLFKGMSRFNRDFLACVYE
jgi:hypothetical protein